MTVSVRIFCSVADRGLELWDATATSSMLWTRIIGGPDSATEGAWGMAPEPVHPLLTDLQPYIEFTVERKYLVSRPCARQ